MHGFVAWFEVYFTYAHLPTKISTSFYYFIVIKFKALSIRKHIGDRQYFTLMII